MSCPLSLIAQVGLPHLPRQPVGQPGPPSGRPGPRKHSQCLRAPVGRLGPAAVVLGWRSWPGSWSGRSSSGKQPAAPYRGARRTPATGWTVRWPSCRYQEGGWARGGRASHPSRPCRAAQGVGGAPEDLRHPVRGHQPQGALSAGSQRFSSLHPTSHASGTPRPCVARSC